MLNYIIARLTRFNFPEIRKLAKKSPSELRYWKIADKLLNTLVYDFSLEELTSFLQKENFDSFYAVYLIGLLHDNQLIETYYIHDGETYENFYSIIEPNVKTTISMYRNKLWCEEKI